MQDRPLKTSRHRANNAGAGTFLVVATGLAAAFAVASVNALPAVLTALGISAGWLDSISYVAATHRTLLLSIAALGLSCGAVMLWMQQQTSHDSYGEGAASPTLRSITFLGLMLGAALLLAGYFCG